MPGVGNGDTHADAGRAELFAAQDGADHALDIVVCKPPGFVKASDHLTNCLFFRGGAQVHDDRFAGESNSSTLQTVPSPASPRRALRSPSRLNREVIEQGRLSLVGIGSPPGDARTTWEMDRHA